MKLKPQHNRFTTLSLLEKYELDDLNQAENQTLVGEESFKGPVTERSVRDRRWLVTGVVTLVVYLGVCVYLVNLGSVQRLSHPSDFRSELCGTNHLSGHPFLYFLQPLVDPQVRMCVTKCPQETGPRICLYDRSMRDTIYCYDQLKTSLVNKVCMAEEPLNKEAITREVNKESLSRTAMSVVYSSRWWVFLGLLGAISMAWVMTLLINRWVKVVVWGAMWMGILGWVVMAGVARREYQSRVARECLFSLDLYHCA